MKTSHICSRLIFVIVCFLGFNQLSFSQNTYVTATGLGTLTCAGSPYTNIATGNTTGAGHECGNSSADRWYSFTTTTTTNATISLCNSSYDTYLRLYNSGAGSCGTATEIINNDDAPCGLQSEVSLVGLVAGTYIVMVEGFGTAEGVYQIDITLNCVSIPTTSPGGVSGSLKLWLSADQGTSTTTDNATITTWTESSASNTFTAINSPSYQNDVANLFNYNPSVDFDHTSSDHFSGPSVFGTSNITESAVYVIHRTNSAGSGGTLFCEKGLGDGRFMTHYPFIDGNAYWHSINSGGADWSQFVSPTPNNIELTTFEISQANDTKTINKNGLKVSNSGDQTFLLITGDNNNFLVGSAVQVGTTNKDFYPDALIAEVVVHNGGGNLGADRKKIESYLAIKYGVTLDNTAGGIAGDYRSTNNSLIWDASISPAYHNNVIGIGKDDIESLNQKQSHTTNDTTRIYLNSLQTLNSANAGSFSVDDSYVVMGGNQGNMCSSTASNAEIPAGCNIYSRIVREWKVTKTNFSQTYNNDFKLNSCATPTMVNIAHLRLLVDDDGDFSNGGTQCYFNGDGTGIAISYNNPVISVSNISNTHIANNSTKFITIASIDQATPLPVELLNVEIECENNTPILIWSTLSEVNNDYFTIERSTDMENFEELAKVNGNGNSSTLSNYKWTDNNPINGQTYYRLKQTDFDGHHEYLDVRTITCNQTNDISIYPNPTSKTVNINLAKSYVNINIKIKNVLGQIIQENNYNLLKNIELLLEGNKGVYFIEIYSEQEHLKTFKLLKQ